MKLEGKRVLVFGAGISGIGAADLLCKVGACPVIYDGNDKQDPEAIKARLEQPENVDIILGELPEEVRKTLDLVVMSPGVPTDLPIVKTLRTQGLPIWGEVELAYQMGKGKVLAITGTNGKTTTTAMLGKIMSDYLDSVYVVGNIGTPYTSVALDTKEETVTVAEISSFQLETIQDFQPAVSAILNITEDHLNRHHTMEEYIRVKELITRNQTQSDTCILNYEDPVLRKFGETLKTRVLFFSSARKLERGLYLEDETIWYADAEQRFPICKVCELNIVGTHNYENVMAAAGMALAYGVPLEKIQEAVKAFQAVEHRIEFVTEKKGVVYYNDSKGTNPDAAIKGIQAMSRPTFLIGGGYDKGSDYTEWIQAFDGKVKALVLLGATKEKIAQTAKKCGFDQIIMTESLEEAVKVCADHAEPGDAVLLSPACASWDMFPSYEVRGRRFKELVNSL